MIIVDNHEKSKIPQLLKRYGVKIEVMPLEVGDYMMIGPTRSVCVESKSAADYIGSITSGQLNKELYQMSCSYDKNILMIHGSIEQALVYRKLKRQIYANYLAGCVIHESARGNKGSISVLNFNSIYDAVQMLKSLHDLIVNDDIYREPTAKRFKPTPETEKIITIQSFPGIGPKRAKEFKNEFGTIKKFVNTPQEDLMKMKGIGKKLADRVWRHVNEH